MGNSELRQLMASSALLLSAEKIAASGLLPEREEMELRRIIVDACHAFGIPAACERPSAEVIVLSFR